MAAQTQPMPFWKQASGDIARGTVGGISVVLVGHPFDTLKVRLQTQPTQNPVYSGILDCIAKTAKWEGISGFYKGMMSPIAGQMFVRATIFLSYGQAIPFVKETRGVSKMRPSDWFLAGGMAWVLQHFLTIFSALMLFAGHLAFLGLGSFAEGPVDFFKSQMQVQIIREKTIPGYQAEFKGVADAFVKIVRHNGVLGIYQGLFPTLVRNCLAGGMYFMSFEVLRETVAEKRNCTVGELPLLNTFICGGLAGFGYWVPFYPVDVIKSALMTDSYQADKRKYTGFRDAAAKIYAAGGIKSFYRGFIPCLARAFPANGAMLLTVFQLKNMGFPWGH